MPEELVEFEAFMLSRTMSAVRPPVPQIVGQWLIFNLIRCYENKSKTAALPSEADIKLISALMTANDPKRTS